MRNKIIAGVVGIVILAGAFYAGTVYGKSGTPARGAGMFSGQFRTGAGMPGGVGVRGAGGFVAGQILSADTTSVTVKLMDGSSKIVLIGTSTQVMKTAAGSKSDLTSGTNVVVTGSTNSDGSVSAQSIQIRPQGATSAQAQ